MLPTLAPQSDHVLDWFHVAMRFQVLGQTAKGLVDQPPGVKAWAIKSLDRAKWHLWHGHSSLELLEDVQGWTHAKREATPLVISNLRGRLGDLGRLVTVNRDSIPCYARRYRYGLPISTAPTESAVNQIVSRRMLKKQQMRWCREGAHRLLEVRVKVLNGSLEEPSAGGTRGFTSRWPGSRGKRDPTVPDALKPFPPGGRVVGERPRRHRRGQ
jgi:hypothetical protein